MDQLAQDILTFIKNELSGVTGAMEIEHVEKKRHVNEDVSTEKYLTEVDKKTLLVSKNKIKSTKLEFNSGLDFSNSRVSTLGNHPEDKISGLNDRYEQNYLNVTNEDKISALKVRYEQYEETIKPTLSSNGINYQRIHLNQLSADSQVVIIGFVKIIDEDTKVKLDEFALDCLDPNGEPYALNCFIDLETIEYEGFEQQGIQLFPMRLVAVQGIINEEQELKIEKVFSAPGYQNTAP
jgi:predicted DNA binding CopG/RHH family protein